MPGKLLFLTLKTFSFTGGIEKMCRTLIRCLVELDAEGNSNTTIFAMYDRTADLDCRYEDSKKFKGFSGRRLWFVLSALRKGISSDHIILSHINLLFPALLIKTISPKTKISLFAHGIEVWRPLHGWKKRFLNRLDTVIAVSEYTRIQIIELHGLDPQKVVVLNNALDPFYVFPEDFTKPAYLLNRYALTDNQPILFTLTRLSASEKYKGYDQVIETLPKLLATFPYLQYLIAGKHDPSEKERIEALILRYNVEQHVKLIGFIPEAELSDHFLLADLFVMPSKREGFGIVFIEAMASGLPVIAGNKDGSVDAVKNSGSGFLVDPDNPDELVEAISRQLAETKGPEISHKAILSKKTATTFGFEQYKAKLRKLLFSYSPLAEMPKRQR